MSEALGQAERVARIRDALARAHGAVQSARAWLAAMESVMSTLETMLATAGPDAVMLRRALDAVAGAQHACNEATNVALEAADRVVDALGARTRLMV